MERILRSTSLIPRIFLSWDVLLNLCPKLLRYICTHVYYPCLYNFVYVLNFFQDRLFCVTSFPAPGRNCPHLRAGCSVQALWHRTCKRGAIQARQLWYFCSSVDGTYDILVSSLPSIVNHQGFQFKSSMNHWRLRSLSLTWSILCAASV